MKLCPHGKAARKCPYQIPWEDGFCDCTNMKRDLLDVEWCGKTPEECKGNLERKEDGSK